MVGICIGCVIDRRVLRRSTLRVVLTLFQVLFWGFFMKVNVLSLRAPVAKHLAAGVFSAVCMASLIGVAHASPTTLINDQFSGSSGTYLNGRTPDTTNDGSQWVQYGVAYNNGGAAFTPTSTDAITLTGSGSAAFALYNGTNDSDLGAAVNFNADVGSSAGPLTASATLDATNNGGEWLAIGFGPANPTNNYGPWAGGPWVLETHSGNVQFFATGGTAHQVATITLTGSSHNISISYDPGTTTVTAFAGSTEIGSYTYGGANAPAPTSFGSVFVDDRYKFTYTPVSGATNYGTFSNLVVTGTAVPEPGPAGILGLGLAGGLLLVRRNRKC